MSIINNQMSDTKKYEDENVIIYKRYSSVINSYNLSIFTLDKVKGLNIGIANDIKHLKDKNIQNIIYNIIKNISKILKILNLNNNIYNRVSSDSGIITLNIPVYDFNKKEMCMLFLQYNSSNNNILVILFGYTNDTLVQNLKDVNVKGNIYNRYDNYFYFQYLSKQVFKYLKQNNNKIAKKFKSAVSHHRNIDVLFPPYQKINYNYTSSGLRYSGKNIKINKNQRVNSNIQLTIFKDSIKMKYFADIFDESVGLTDLNKWIRF